MIGIRLILCPTNHDITRCLCLVASRGEGALAWRLAPGGSLGDCPDHSYFILTTFLTHACAAFGEPFDWDRSRRKNLDVDITSDL